MKPWAGTVWIGETGDAGLAPQGRDLYLGGVRAARGEKRRTTGPRDEASAGDLAQARCSARQILEVVAGSATAPRQRLET